MATNFPASLDSLTNPTSSDSLNSPSHSAQHANANDAIEAIETALLDGAPLHIDDANERVGVGNASPSYKLDVTGDINATGALRIGAAAVGEWQDFPAGTGFTGITEGNGTLIQRYCVLNDLVFFEATFELGSTSALSDGGFTLPVAMTDADSALHFSAGIADGSTGYAAMVRRLSGTTCLIRALDASSTYVSQAIISSTVPFTWGTADAIAISGFYEKG